MPTITREQLQSIEWAGQEGQDFEPYCPVCDNPRRRGHGPNCWLSAALATPDDEPPPATLTEGDPVAPSESTPRYSEACWNSGGFLSPAKEEFAAWLNRVAPAGARLAAVVVHPPWPGRPEMGETRECLFELSEPAPVAPTVALSAEQSGPIRFLERLLARVRAGEVRLLRVESVAGTRQVDKGSHYELEPTGETTLTLWCQQLTENRRHP